MMLYVYCSKCLKRLRYFQGKNAKTGRDLQVRLDLYNFARKSLLLYLYFYYTVTMIRNTVVSHN